MKFEGKNAVFELINSSLTIEKIQIQDGNCDVKIREIVSLARAKNVRVDFVAKNILDKESETGHHQGVIAYATEFIYAEFEDVIKRDGRKFFIILDGVMDPHNLGSVLRIGDCSGVTGIIIPKNRSATVNETVVRVSAGAAAHVPVCKVTNLVTTIKCLKNIGVWVYAADMDGDELYKSNLKGDVAIVVGGEGDGVSKLVKSECDGVIKIPMFGKVNSLNASVSAGIVAYEVVRQNM